MNDGENAMTLCGHQILPHDERGWRIPRPGTKSRLIYDLLVQGYSAPRIADMLGLNGKTADALAYRIRNPARTNTQQLVQRHRIRRRQRGLPDVPVVPITENQMTIPKSRHRLPNRRGRPFCRRTFTRADDELILAQSRGEITMMELIKQLHADRLTIIHRADEMGVLLGRLSRSNGGNKQRRFPVQPVRRSQPGDSTNFVLNVGTLRGGDPLLARLLDEHGDRRYKKDPVICDEVQVLGRSSLPTSDVNGER